MLIQFIDTHRDEILQRCSERMADRAGHADMAIFAAPINSLIEVVRRSVDDGEDAGHLVAGNHVISRESAEHGAQRANHNFDVAQIARDYGIICDAITSLADDLGLTMPTNDFRALNLAIDCGIAASLKQFDASRMVEQRQASAQTIGSFAHELRNALASASLACEILKSGRVGYGGKTADVLERALQRMERMMSQLVARVTLDASPEPQLEIHAIEELIEESIDTVSGPRRDRIVIDNAGEGRFPDSLLVRADRQLAVSALSNVMQNGLKYSESGKNVIIRAWYAEDGHAVVVEIQDFGPGICAVAQEHLFAPFRRGNDNGRSGLGLGLAIVRHAMEAQGGKLTLQSESGQGSTFALHFQAVLLASPA